MSDEALRRQLQTIDGEDPSDEFVDGLRLRMRDESSQIEPLPGDVITVVDPGASDDVTRRRSWPIWPLSAAAVLLGAVLLMLVLPDEGPSVETAATTEAREVGDAWLAAVIDNDRESFVALHATDLETNDTLMAYSRDVDLLTPTRISELYLDGFDAFQTSLAVDGDFVRSGGCEDIGEQQVRCNYTASMIGSDDYTYTVAAELTVEDRQVTVIEFSEISTEPADLRSRVQGFLDEAANDEDRACLLLGFNTLGCGEHDSNFMQRYVSYYEAQQNSTE